MPGVLTTDPRKVGDAQLMEQVGWAMQTRGLGASVLHLRVKSPDSVPLVVRSS